MAVAWVKDAVSRSPKTVYTAPESDYPMVAVVYDPNAANKWSIEYAWLDSANGTQSTIESLMGL